MKIPCPSCGESIEIGPDVAAQILASFRRGTTPRRRENAIKSGKLGGRPSGYKAINKGREYKYKNLAELRGILKDKWPGEKWTNISYSELLEKANKLGGGSWIFEKTV